MHELAARLSLPGAFRPPRTTVDAPLTSFRMETDDATILKQLYRAFRPMRHLEFGTWEGFGARLCAENCEARIWTINLPEGERNESGAPSYADATGATDAGDRIGRLYREACYEERVVQILADSRDYDWSRFEPGFFDTVLIDGGHSQECVSSDTEVALKLVRPAGLCDMARLLPGPGGFARANRRRGRSQSGSRKLGATASPSVGHLLGPAELALDRRPQRTPCSLTWARVFGPADGQWSGSAWLPMPLRLRDLVLGVGPHELIIDAHILHGEAVLDGA